MMPNFVSLLLFASCALAFPYDNEQIVLGAGKKSLDKWFQNGRQFIMQNSITYELFSHPSPKLDQYQLRLTEPNLCDTTVQQYSGYLDVAQDKHLFFWFFESRNSPEDAPLILWLNGGPGCSSSTGLLFELGPCRIADGGKNITFNELSWNTQANIIFLDQPVNVGFSYGDDGTTVNNSPVVGQDVYAFLELFFNRFPKYSKLPFHLAAESYGGTYGPHIASVIHNENKNPAPGFDKINLQSLILANGQTDPYIQMGSVADYVCDGPYPVYSDPQGPECMALRAKIPTCQRLLKMCYDTNSRLACTPALLYCNTQVISPVALSGINPYDVRKPCDRSKDGNLCYAQMDWIEVWMNDPTVKAALGADPTRTFESCNLKVNQEFLFQGDGAHNSAKLLPELIDDGIRLLVYAGHADMMCNYIGNERWVEALSTSFSDEFSVADHMPWILEDKQVGEVRSAGGDGFTAGNLTFVNVYDAGHMVPYDVPEAALDLITRWLKDTPLA